MERQLEWRKHLRAIARADQEQTELADHLLRQVRVNSKGTLICPECRHLCRGPSALCDHLRWSHKHECHELHEALCTGRGRDRLEELLGKKLPLWHGEDLPDWTL